MEKSESITKLIVALLIVQKEIEPVKKEAENPFFKSKYADLPSLMGACKSILNKNKIVVLQPITGDFVETILIHESGEWVSGKTKIIVKSANDPQAQGSAISYARRYGLQSILFMSAEDDDAETAMGRTTTATPYKATSQQDLMMEFKMNSSQIAPKCSSCGTLMILVKRKDGSGIFWSCPNWKSKGCQGLNINQVNVSGEIVDPKKVVKKTATNKEEKIEPDDIPF